MKKVLLIILTLSIVLCTVACDKQKVYAPSTSDVRKAVEQEYNMEFELLEKEISNDESRGEWVFISEDETLEVTVNWNSDNPEKYVFDDKKLKDSEPESMTEMTENTQETKETKETTEESTAEPTFYEVGYSDAKYYSIGVGSEYINLWSFTTEVPQMVELYVSMHPEFGQKYTVLCTIVPTDGGAYQTELDNILVNGGDYAPDIYVAEAAFVNKYTKGDMSEYAATYESLGIDADTKVLSAEIAPYSVDVGTRNGEIVALAYQSTGGVMIYRSSIANEVFGTDDPNDIETIFGGGTGSWDDFINAAYTLYNSGYAVVSGIEDVWQVCDSNASQPWLVDGNITIAPEREYYMDLAKTLYDNGLTNGTSTWSSDWYEGMSASGTRQVFCYLGPAWLINYVMEGNSYNSYSGHSSYGDWRVCVPPVGFFWGGTWILGRAGTRHSAGVAELLEWITLDTSDTGLQYFWANDKFGNGAFDTVTSGVVMSKSSWYCDFCGGQDMFPVFIAADYIAPNKACSIYDDDFSYCFKDATDYYLYYGFDKISAMNIFKENANDILYYYY